MTVPKDDWRWRGQEQYLTGAILYFCKYQAPSKEWDHDHCEFCWETLMEEGNPDTLQEGYCTQDRAYWICQDCFTDFEEQLAFEQRSEQEKPHVG